MLLLSVFTTINEVFEALFFSEYGSIMGMLLFVILCTAIVVFKHELAFITFLLTIFLMLEYLTYWGTYPLFIWYFIILAVFGVLQIAFFFQKAQGRG